MPSLLTINTVDFTDVYRENPSPTSVLFSSEIRKIFTSPNFGNLLNPNVIPGSKLQPIEGANLSQMTLSGYNGPSSPGQIALGTIRAENIAINGVRGPQGGVPPGTVIFFAGPDFDSATLPDGYLLCDGSYVSTATYPDLFLAIGYRYGANGQNQFRLPALQIFQDLIPLIKA